MCGREGPSRFPTVASRWRRSTPSKKVPAALRTVFTTSSGEAFWWTPASARGLSRRSIDGRCSGPVPGGSRGPRLMSVAYIDTSALVAVLFDEPEGGALGSRLDTFSHVVPRTCLKRKSGRSCTGGACAQPGSSGRYQVGSAGAPTRTRVYESPGSWLSPRRRLWHLATALYLAEDPKDISFLTRDRRQEAVASALGFRS